MLSLIACANKPEPVDEITPPASEVTPYAPTVYSPPQVTITSTPEAQKPLPNNEDVYTDYSAYTPYKRINDEIYTRLSADFLSYLIPSDDYGALVPYVGECFGMAEDDYFAMYGLCTKDGMIVTDPVYRAAYQPSRYNAIFELIERPVYKLVRLEAVNEKIYKDSFSASGSDSENEHMSAESEDAANKPLLQAIPNIAICALNGSWVTDYYYKVDFYEGIMLLHREKDADVIDYNGNFLYNTQDLNVDIQMNDDPSFIWSNHIVDYSDGLFFLKKWILVGKEEVCEGEWRDIRSAQCAFVNELTGEAFILPYEEVNAFSDGRAKVKQGGLWGYINTDMELIIDFQFDYATAFFGGLANCRLLDGRYVLINKDGEIVDVSDQYLSNPAEKSYFDNLEEPESNNYSFSRGVVYDKNGKTLFTYDANLDYLEHADVFTLSYNKDIYGHWSYTLVKFEIIDSNGKCVFRKNVVSQWCYD